MTTRLAFRAPPLTVCLWLQRQAKATGAFNHRHRKQHKSLCCLWWVCTFRDLVLDQGRLHTNYYMKILTEWTLLLWDNSDVCLGTRFDNKPVLLGTCSEELVEKSGPWWTLPNVMFQQVSSMECQSKSCQWSSDAVLTYLLGLSKKLLQYNSDDEQCHTEQLILA